MTERTDAVLREANTMSSWTIIRQRPTTYAVIAPELTAYNMIKLTLLFEPLKDETSRQSRTSLIRQHNILLEVAASTGKIPRKGESNENIHERGSTESTTDSDLNMKNCIVTNVSMTCRE